MSHVGLLPETVGGVRVDDHPWDRSVLLLEILFPLRSLSLSPLLISHPHGFEFCDHASLFGSMLVLKLVLHRMLSLQRGLLCRIPRHQLREDNSRAPETQMEK